MANERMKIVANVDGDEFTKELARTLRSRGVKVKQLKRAAVIDLPTVSGKCRGKTYRIPRALADAEPSFFIDACEDSGVLGEKSFATVVCGVAGSMLRPYYINSRRRGDGLIMARFCVPQSLVTVRCCDGKVLITRHAVDTVRKGEMRIESETLWHGADSDIPPELSHFNSAVGAAIRKANSKHPMRLYFAQRQSSK